MKEYIERLNTAWNHFNWATDPIDVDVAIYELMAAERAMAHIKEEGGETDDSMFAWRCG